MSVLVLILTIRVVYLRQMSEIKKNKKIRNCLQHKLFFGLLDYTNKMPSFPNQPVNVVFIFCPSFF